MKIALLALLVSLLAVASLTPLVRLLALRVGAVSRPGGRDVHQRSIPRLGGLAICGGVLAAAAALYLGKPEVSAVAAPFALRLLGLGVGGVAMCAVGVVDDARGLRAFHKLLLQIAVAVFAIACGCRIDALHVPLLGDFNTAEVALPLTTLWIVGLVNAINLIDGLDGLAAGVVLFAATTNLVVAWINGVPLVAWISAATAGAALGFLFYNFNPARIFMGASGSYFFGYVLAVTALMGTQKASTAASLLVPMMALGVPIFDTLFAMVRRILERRSVFSPDRGHIHHRLLDMGLTHRRAVLILYTVCGVLTVAAIGVSLERTWQLGMALFAASAALYTLVRFVGYFDGYRLRHRQPAQLRAPHTELLRRAIPRLPLRFADASCEAELVDELWRFAADADLCFVEVVDPAGDPRGAHRWPPLDGETPRARGGARGVVTASYPLGRDGVARSTVQFGWHCEISDVPPQSEILLQIVADLLTQNLTRLRSALVPASERLVSEPPDVLNIPARPSRV